MIKVSVIIPVYNVEPFLDACLESVLRQSLKDIELICIDDCSTDRSFERLCRAAEADSRIRVFQNATNRNSSYSRNRGLHEAHGTFVFFLDSDDILYGEKALESLYRVAVEDDVDIVFGGVIDWYENKEIVNEAVSPKRSARKTDVVAHPFLARHVAPWNKLLRRELLLEHAIFFDEQLLKFEDNDFSCRTVVHARSISYLAELTYKYRQRSGADKSKMYVRSPEDAFWKCRAAHNMATAVRDAALDVRRVYAENIGDMLRGAYEDFIQYGDGRVAQFLEALLAVFTSLPEGVASSLPVELQLARDALLKGRFAAAWSILFLHRKARLLYYVRCLVPLLRHSLARR